MAIRARMRLFAILRELAAAECELELDDAATVEDAWQALAARFPALAAYREWVRPARGGSYVEWSQPLTDGDELAFLPPVSGGAPTVGLTAEPIDVDALEQELVGPGHGAVLRFEGRARDHADDGRRVLELEYEAYADMAEAVLQEIAAEAQARWGARIGIVHRVGIVPIGELAVAIVAAAAHRSEAYDASRYAIEAVKERLPIWKRERFTDGSEWKRPGA